MVSPFYSIMKYNTSSDTGIIQAKNMYKNTPLVLINYRP